MKRKYRIGFFAGAFLLAATLAAGYQISYKNAVRRQQEEQEAVDIEKETVSTKGDAEKNGGFYLCELHGCVAIYLDDKKTIYELTTIHLWELPKEVREEIKRGKYVEDEETLYGFLENYTS